MEQVVEIISKKILDANIRDILSFMSSLISDTQLKNLLLKSFVQYPHYAYLKKEAELSIRTNAKQYHQQLNVNAVNSLIYEGLKEIDASIKKEARDCFDIFTNKLKYSVRYRYLIDTDDFKRLDAYLRGSYDFY